MRTQHKRIYYVYIRKEIGGNEKIERETVEDDVGMRCQTRWSLYFAL